MKPVLNIIVFLYLFLTITGCDNKPKTITSKNPIASSKTVEVPYITNDSIVIVDMSGSSSAYTKSEFNRMLDNHPELYSEYVYDPDYTYSCLSNKEGFGSEVGKDNYYSIYAYFLRKKNSDPKYEAVRQSIWHTFLNINQLFWFFEYGGTYFGHQAARIEGYTEYAVYLYARAGDSEKDYDIDIQKKLYVQSLRQLVDDEISVDYNTLTLEGKLERKKELNKIVDSIERGITSLYYLRMAQEFQYSHYIYF